MACFIRIFCFILFAVLGEVESKGSNRISYRAVRYGSYYSSTYFSYSGGKGYARYSRAYNNNKKNLYPSLYNYMFKWFQTEDFKIYKKTPSGYISVCKNYEADTNGTYLGIFTCPLPFVPESHSYCCGVTNAQYCCRFWDIPLNMAAALIGMLMAVLILAVFIHIIIQLCINRRRVQKHKEEQQCLRRIGRMRLMGRQPSMRSVPMWKYFDNVHSESTFREGRIDTEEEEYSDAETFETRLEVVPTNNNTDVGHNDKSILVNARIGQESDTINLVNDVNVKHAHSDRGIRNEAFTDIDQAHGKINSNGVRPPLKPLRKKSNVNFNCPHNANVTVWYYTENGGSAK